MSTSVPKMRLDRLLANLGYGSRRDIHMIINARRVRLDDALLKTPDMKIALDPDLPDRLRIDNAALDPLPGLVLMLHKPVGVICSHNEAGPLVHQLLPERWQRREPALSTIGRLDKDTSGLLLLTDDGALLHAIISPRASILKRYHVTLDRPLNGDEGDVIASGTLMLAGESKPLLPARLDVISPFQAYLTIVEGRYHQVRRMFAALGNHVTALHRDKIGRLNLPDDLPAGSFRILSQEDIAAAQAEE